MLSKKVFKGFFFVYFNFILVIFIHDTVHSFIVRINCVVVFKTAQSFSKYNFNFKLKKNFMQAKTYLIYLTIFYQFFFSVNKLNK